MCRGNTQFYEGQGEVYREYFIYNIGHPTKESLIETVLRKNRHW